MKHPGSNSPLARLAVANQKGGVGKTTTAIHLAHGFALAGLETLLIDLDPQGNASTALGAAKQPGSGATRLLRGEIAADSVVPVSERLGICTGEGGLLLEEGRLATAEGRTAFARALDAVASPYQRVVVDCPPALGRLTRAALAWVDEVVVPIQCEFLAMEGLTQVLAVVESIRRGENPGLRLGGILITMFDPALEFHREVVSDVRKNLGGQVLRTMVPRDVALAEAASHGVPVVDYDCLSCGAHAYMQLTREILEHGGEATR